MQGEEGGEEVSLLSFSSSSFSTSFFFFGCGGGRGALPIGAWWLGNEVCLWSSSHYLLWSSSDLWLTMEFLSGFQLSTTVGHLHNPSVMVV